MPAELLGKTPLVTDLQRADAYPLPPPTRVDLVTTHISWVFLTDHDVWKVKRPVAYGFVDYTTLEQRRHFCDEEVRLNRRLAPGVYLGVVPVRLGPAGHTLTGDGPTVDYAVHMRRLPDAASAEALLRSGALTHDHLGLIAATLARFCHLRRRSGLAGRIPGGPRRSAQGADRPGPHPRRPR
jgi:aminoglycoside phosphotransferase family enzyme